MKSMKDEKTKTELQRIPSPSSVSSVHSIRPLEWDSGADVGYQCELQPGLSTVERIALVSGTVNLLETCKAGGIFDTSYKKYKFDTPVAHSSPCFTDLNFINKKKKSSACKINVNSENVDKRNAQPLVEYSLTSEHSIDERTENSLKSNNYLKIIDIDHSESKNSLTDNDSKLLISEGSKSLDDLRSLNRLQRITKSVSYGSRRSQSMFASLNRKNSNEKSHLSSSSATTIISQDDKNFSSVPNYVPKFLSKGIQVDEACLDQKPEGCTNQKNYPTYTIEDSYRFFQLLNKCDTSDCLDMCERNDEASGSNQTNTESVEGGSFEYVPGSVYDVGNEQLNFYNEQSKESSSEVNTLCTEVIDGVDLITRYVDNLRVSNKRKVIKKMAQVLISNLASDEKRHSTESDFAENVSSLFRNSSAEFRVKTVPSKRLDHSASLTTSSVESNSRTADSINIVPKIGNFNSKRKKSSNKKGSDDFKLSTSNSVNFSGKGGVTSQSSMPAETTKSSHTYNSSSSSTISSCKIQSPNFNSSNMYSLKQYLTKERDAQLLWIKSGIDHLNNLKKLYESQRMLRKDLNAVKKIKNAKITNSTSECSCNYDCKCSRQFCGKKKNCQRDNVSENKENISDFSKILNHRQNCKETNKISNPVVRKKPISYTVIFDKKPTIVTRQNFMVREQTVRKSVSKTYLKKNRMRKTTSTTELRYAQKDTKPLSSLQEYLLQNKPEYVNRAEMRRQCLFEIAKLRELRDKSRNELLSVLNSNDGNNDVLSHVPPPPLSVLRIFNDKSIRRHTEKKYQQLPEVQNKKLELRRKESYRTNQIMAKVFTKKLQKKVLRGQVNLGNSVDVIST